MKTYKQRLPQIDEAIFALGGDIEKAEFSRLPEHNYLWPDRAGGYLFAQKGSWAFNVGKTFCTRTEFEQRARELGWVSGYKWGVEYPTNGEKPDLPDDVLVEILSDDGESDLGVRQVKFNAWGRTKSFRIVDERYKPKEEAFEFNTQTVYQNATDDWDGAGLPPVGTVCDYYRAMKDSWCPVYVCHVGSKYLVMRYHGISGAEFCRKISKARLRPLRTERDELIEKAERAIEESTGEVANSAHIGALYDAGMLQSPTETKND